MLVWTLAISTLPLLSCTKLLILTLRWLARSSLLSCLATGGDGYLRRGYGTYLVPACEYEAAVIATVDGYHHSDWFLVRKSS
jgi:hypothetical protein